MKKSIGMGIEMPKKKPAVKDDKDPFFGKISLRGRSFVGEVISDKMTRTVTVQWERRKFVPKYERYKKVKSRLKAHNPDSINAKTGDKVKIMETRPISKTKKFVVVQVLNSKE